jgi:hypothetical protein
MARKCDCSVILEAFETDPRLACLPLAVRALWLVLVRRMQALGQSVLVFGSEIPNPAEIAMMVPMAETELETQLAPLLARGLLVRREDGALESPLLAGRMKRAETARINGLKGGRPRKDAAPAAQRSMPLPIAGGRAGVVAETHGKPTEATMGSPAKLSSASPEKAEAQAGKPREVITPELVTRIGQAAAEAAGLDAARGTWTFGPVRQWLEAGADEALILATIAAVMARPNASPRGLGYFGPAVLEALATRAAPVEEPAPAGEWAETAEDYLARHAAWQARGCLGEVPVRRRAA